MKTILPIVGGWGVYLLVLPIAIAIAGLFGVEPSLLWPSLLAALLAGLFTGHIHSKKAVMLGAIAACPLIILLALTTWLTGNADLNNFGVAGNATLGLVVFSPLVGAIGGWIGAHWLPQSLLSEGQPVRFAGSWKASGGVMFGIVLFVLLINVPEFPLYWLMAGIALISFSYTGYLWFYAQVSTREKKYGMVLFAVFGTLAILMTAYLWTSPLPVIHWGSSVSIILGALLGVAVLRLGIKN